MEKRIDKELQTIEELLDKENTAVYRPETRTELLITHLVYIMAKELQYVREEVCDLKEVLVTLAEKDSKPSPGPGRPKKDSNGGS